MFGPNVLRALSRLMPRLFGAHPIRSSHRSAYQVALALLLPAASMLLGEQLRDAYLMALEACTALGTVVVLVGPRKMGPTSRRGWAWAAVLMALGGADLIYNLPGPQAPRYPRNHFADVLLLFCTLALIVMASRGFGQRRRLGSLLLAWAVALAALKLEVVYVLAPLMRLPALPFLAACNAWLYACSCSVLCGLLLVRSWRAVTQEELLAAQGLLLMLASDFAQRHDALITVGAMGWSEAGWAAGLGLVAVALRQGQGQLPWRASSPEAAWHSARCALGGLTFLGNLVLLVGSLMGGLLAIDGGDHVAGLLWLFWISWFASNTLALRLHLAMEHIGASLPAPHITWCTAQHPVAVQLQPITTRTRLTELDGWITRYNQLVRQFNPLIAGASRHQENDAYNALAEHLAHDIRAPIAAIQSAIAALGSREEASVQVLHQASARIHDVAQALLTARRNAGEHHHGQGHTLPAAAPQKVQPHVATSLRRVVELVQRDLRVRHGEAWAHAVVLPHEEALLAAPLSPLVAALNNLLDNAIEATPLGPGAVALRVSLGQADVFVHVVDLGSGMPRQVLEALGKRTVTAGKRDGNGLGVMAATQAAHLWGGSLHHRMPPGGGTIATLRIPQAACAAPPLAAQKGADAIPLTVLVDDDVLVRSAWQLSADHVGAAFVAFASAQACLVACDTLAQNTAFYLDTQLGGAMTGHDLARALYARGFLHLVVMQSLGGGAVNQMEMGSPKNYRIVHAKGAPFAPLRREGGGANDA